MICGETEHTISEGDAIFINSNVLHKLRRAHADVPSRINSLVFMPALVSSFPQSIVQQRYILPMIRCASLSKVLLHRDTSWQLAAIKRFQNAFGAFVGDAYVTKCSCRPS